jgi:enolase
MALYVMRHGESLWNKENKFTGWVDVDLSEQGKKEAISAGLQLKNIHFDHIITSDLKRTQQTAVLVIDGRPEQEKEKIIFNITECIKERNYGDLAGIVKSELKKKYGDEQMHKWRRSYSEAPPNGESLHDVKLRVGQFYDSFIAPLLEQNKNILMVAHGNTLRALFVHLGFKDEKTIEDFELATATPIKIDTYNLTFNYLNDFELIGTQIFDSRGFPTIEVSCIDKKSYKIIGKGSSPSGASCGSNEVIELRDENPDFFKGKSVCKAIDNLSIINRELSLNHRNYTNLKVIDELINKIDTTKNKCILGGNTTTAVSFCLADVASKALRLEMYEYIHQIYNKNGQVTLPTPFVNIINGGKHGVTDDLKIQEFMIFPNEIYSIDKKMQIISEVYHTLKSVLVKKYGKHAKSIGDEGGFCPPIYTTEEALTVIEQAISEASYIVGEDVFLALDCAASEFYNKDNGIYEVEKGKFLTSSQLIDFYGNLIEKHPALKSIEDAFDEQDYETWKEFTHRFGDKIMIVGDDLFTTNPKFIKKGIEEKWANTLLLKVNQIGTVSEAIEAAQLMLNKNNKVIVSHRSGETNHAFIVDLAVGIGAHYLKIGSPCRGERVAKFNRLIEIEQIMKMYV